MSRTENSPTAGIPEHRLLRNPVVVSERFGDEAVLVHLGRGRYYSLDRGAAAIWSILEDEPTEEALLAGASDPKVAAEARALLDRLVEEDLVRRQPPGEGDPGSASPRTAPLPAAPMTLEVFTDLEDLLILDPIHDIGDAGWPARPSPHQEP